MPVCRICGREFAVDELGAHIIEAHPGKDRTRLGAAKRELKSTVLVLHRLEKQGVALADYAQDLRKVANVLGVALDELESLQKEVKGLGDELEDIDAKGEEEGKE